MRRDQSATSRKPIPDTKTVKVVAAVRLHYYLLISDCQAVRELTTSSRRHTKQEAESMNRSLVILTLCTLATGCVVAVNTGSSRNGATESSLMQADRDFAVASHARGIDGWMSFYTPDAIRIRYRGNMVKGFDEIRKFDMAYISDTTNVLNWEPTDAHVFRGGDIGSTTGRYWAVSRAGPNAGKETGRGRYVTMWRREGGRWLVIMDTGYPEPATPAP